MNRQKSILDKGLTCKRLKGLISESSYTYEEIAEFLELNSPRVIYEWIKGTKFPSIENLYNLCLLLGIKIEDCLVMR